MGRREQLQQSQTHKSKYLFSYIAKKNMKLTVEKSILLNQDLTGLGMDGSKIRHGLLNESLDFKSKYWLTKLSNELNSELDQLQKHFQTEREKLDTDQEKFDLWNETLQMEIEIKDYQFSVDQFDFKSNSNYFIFIELFLT